MEWCPGTPWGHRRDGTGVVGSSLAPLTDTPAEPLAMALSAHQTPTLGFRAGEDVSELSEGMERRR